MIAKSNFQKFAAFMVFAGLLLGSASLVSGAQKRLYRVSKVIDGDTVLLANGKLVRYIGIDAPEIDHLAGVAEAYGFEARRLNSMLIRAGAGYVRLEYGRQLHDRYGRVLAYVYDYTGRMLNTAILRAGLAHMFFHRSNPRYYRRLLHAQQEAMRNKRGMWKFWSEPGGMTFIGNLASGRFHLSTCPLGQSVAPRNRCLLATAWDAYYRGLSPCRVCQPRLTSRRHDNTRRRR